MTKAKELQIKDVKVSKRTAKNEINEAIYIDFLASQIQENREKISEETEKALFDLRKKTINHIFELEKESMYDDERHKRIEDFVINEMLNDEYLKSKLDNSILNGKGKYGKIAHTLVSKTKDKFDEQTTQGYIEYYWDWNMKAYKLIKLTSVPTVYFMDDTHEVFLLDHPAKLLRGKPVYICLRSIPFALPMDFRIMDLAKELKNLKKINPRFVFSRATLTSFDIYNKFQSLIVFRIFTPPKLTWKSLMFNALSMGIGALIMWTFTSPYIFASGV